MSAASTDTRAIPIHRVAHHHYLYSTPSISSLRATHSIPGTLIGTLPQCPQQNVFLGLPLLLSHSEARRLVTTGAAYIVDDVAVHKAGLKTASWEAKQRWISGLREEGLEVAREEWERKVEERERVLGGIDEGKRDMVRETRRREKEKKAAGETQEKFDTDTSFESMEPYRKLSPFESKETDRAASLVAQRGVLPLPPRRPEMAEQAQSRATRDEEDALFPSSAATAFFTSDRSTNEVADTSSNPTHEDNSPAPLSSSDNTPQTSRDTTPDLPTTSNPTTTTIILPPPPDSRNPKPELIPHAVTPTLSHPLIPLPPPPPPPPPPRTTAPSTNHPPPPTPATQLHSFLHSQAYFLLPGLRFGAHFNAYPGDPLRFHAHFACRAYAWAEAVPLLEIVGGGRLGTGVKKGFLMGGAVEDVRVDGDADGDELRREERAWGAREDGRRVRCFTVEWGGM